MSEKLYPPFMVKLREGIVPLDMLKKWEACRNGPAPSPAECDLWDALLVAVRQLSGENEARLFAQRALESRVAELEKVVSSAIAHINAESDPDTGAPWLVENVLAMLDAALHPRPQLAPESGAEGEPTKTTEEEK